MLFLVHLVKLLSAFYFYSSSVVIWTYNLLDSHMLSPRFSYRPGLKYKPGPNYKTGVHLETYVLTKPRHR